MIRLWFLILNVFEIKHTSHWVGDFYEAISSKMPKLGGKTLKNTIEHKINKLKRLQFIPLVYVVMNLLLNVRTPLKYIMSKTGSKTTSCSALGCGYIYMCYDKLFRCNDKTHAASFFRVSIRYVDWWSV